MFSIDRTFLGQEVDEESPSAPAKPASTRGLLVGVAGIALVILVPLALIEVGESFSKGK